VLAVSIDPPEDRTRIPAFLRKYGLGLKILLADPSQLTGYDHEGAGVTYLIDRKGMVAGVPAITVRRLDQVRVHRICG